MTEDDYSYPGHVFRFFYRLVADPGTDHLMPEVRMVRLYVNGRRAFLERRWHPDHSYSPWAIVCPDPDTSEREVMAVWKARSLAFDADVQIGRPTGPTPGSAQERWLALVDRIGEPAARAQYYAQTPRGPGRYDWWEDNILRALRRRKHRQ